MGLMEDRPGRDSLGQEGSVCWVCYFLLTDEFRCCNKQDFKDPVFVFNVF